ncbi:MAG: hypothetical protein ACI4XQ_06055 [Eubacteriales bacterium]
MVTLFCGLGTGMFFSAQDMIYACENGFLTLAVFEYSGSAVFESFASDPKALAALEELDAETIGKLGGEEGSGRGRRFPGRQRVLQDRKGNAFSG